LSNPPAYRGLHVYYGDLHNHCNISYGHGDLEEAYANARLQLDFASVTGHAHWPDMPPAEGRLKYLVEYHQRGFERLASVWDRVQDTTEAFHEEHRFVSFLSFEWHSMRHGDYCVYYKGSRGEILRSPDIASMRRELSALAGRGVGAVMIPHHICYLRGYRGINWEDFDERFSPVVEVLSMHGCAEDDDAPRPYLHSMGPRDGESTMIRGLVAGKKFGIIGSTDHHSAHPGSHDHGRLAVWARELTRDGIWEAIQSRRTYALTGDRIALAFSLNGAPMGSILHPCRDRAVEVTVTGGAPLDYVDLVKSGVAIARRSASQVPRHDAPGFKGKVTLAVGWGEADRASDWRVSFGVRDGRLLGVEPRFKGEESVSPQAEDLASYQVSSWNRSGDAEVRFTTRTSPNPNTRTDRTQKFTLEIEGDGRTQVVASINGQDLAYSLSELRQGPRTGHLDGFVSEAFQLSRAIPEAEYQWRWQVDDRSEADGRDFYYLRVRQKNDQWAWSSPIWV
jgi:hypothetical protein